MRQVFVDEGSSATAPRGISASEAPENGSPVGSLIPRSGVDRRAPQRAISAVERRLGRLTSTVLALLGLIAVAAVAVATNVDMAALLHLISPKRQFDAFSAIHQPLVVWILIALSIVWLMPPHPWTHRVALPKGGDRRHLPDRRQAAA